MLTRTPISIRIGRMIAATSNMVLTGAQKPPFRFRMARALGISFSAFRPKISLEGGRKEGGAGV